MLELFIIVLVASFSGGTLSNLIKIKIIKNENKSNVSNSGNSKIEFNYQFPIDEDFLKFLRKQNDKSKKN